MQQLYQAIEKLFEKYHYPAHDFKHALRVSKLARKIAEAERYDPVEAEVAGILHDVGRTVEHPTQPHAQEGVPIAKQLLEEYTDFSDEVKTRILEAIEKHSDRYTEGKLNNIVQDADKLDGMGAIGINRSYTATAGRIPDYDPEDILPISFTYGKFKNAHELIAMTMEWYSMLYTDTAKQIGKRRYEFLKHFIEQFKQDIEESK